MNYNYYKIFQYIGFLSSHYVSIITLNVAPFFSVFSKFDFFSQSNVLLFESIKYIFKKKLLYVVN